MKNFIHVNNETNEVFTVKAFDSVEELLSTMKIEDKIDDDYPDSDLNLGKSVAFKGFESLCKQVVDIVDKLFCEEVQIESNDQFDDIRQLFEAFLSKFCAVTLKAKHKEAQNLRHMIIHAY